MVARVQPELGSTWGRLAEEQQETRAKLHIRVFTELLDYLEVGGSGWIRQLVEGCPVASGPAEPGVFPAQPIVTPEIFGHGEESEPPHCSAMGGGESSGG